MNIVSPARGAAVTVFSVAMGSACPNGANNTGGWVLNLAASRCVVFVTRTREWEEVSRFGSGVACFAEASGGASAVASGPGKVTKAAIAARLMALRAKAISEGMTLKSTDEILRDRLAMWENA